MTFYRTPYGKPRPSGNEKHSHLEVTWLWAAFSRFRGCYSKGARQTSHCVAYRRSHKQKQIMLLNTRCMDIQ
ncbi:hypothetical protein VPHD29_0198 [Vibrio phage D29]